MDQNYIYKQIEAHVTELFEQHSDPRLVYHNLEHTISIVDYTKEIAAHYHVTETDTLVLYAAAWFHDVGYLFVPAEEHEQKSVELMRDFMKSCTNDEALLNNIEECILATTRDNHPENLIHQIIADADTYHLGTKEFNGLNKLVKKEKELFHGYIDKGEWIKKNLDFLRQHQYYTSYCKDLLENRKQKNIKWWDEKLNELSKQKGSEGLLFRQKNSFITKGIQTMLRLTSDNHLELSNMADGKANILISVNAIIISVILTVLVRRLEIDTYLIIPTVIFLLVSVTTIVIAIMSTRPKVSTGIFSEQEVMAKKTNLLFFGNFHKVSLEEYEKGMRIMMSDPEYLYGALIKDIHQLGVVLGRKYRLIRIAYNIFMIGIVVSVLAFAIAVIINNSSGGNTINSAGTPL